LWRYDAIFPISESFNYVNYQLTDRSKIHYFITSNPENTVAFNKVDLDINLSNHVPVIAACLCEKFDSLKLSPSGVTPTQDGIIFGAILTQGGITHC
jgi:hypothetical protein